MKRSSKTIFSLFRDRASQPSTPADSVIHSPKRMDLEERKAYRKKMLTQSIRETFLSMGVDASQWTSEVLPTDARHHRFAVMIDVERSFLRVDAVRTLSFAEIEVLVRTNTYNRFGILSVAMYWRVGESDPQFEHSTRSTDGSGSLRQPIAPLQESEADHIRTFSMQVPIVVLDARQTQADDGSANLDDGIVIGGTQYGRL